MDWVGYTSIFIRLAGAIGLAIGAMWLLDFLITWPPEEPQDTHHKAL